MEREVSGPALSSYRVTMNKLILHGCGSSVGTKVNLSPMTWRNMFCQLNTQTMPTAGSETEIPNHWSHAIKLCKSPPPPPPFFNKVPRCSCGTVLKTIISDRVHSLFNLDLFNLCASITFCQYMHPMDLLLFGYAFSSVELSLHNENHNWSMCLSMWGSAEWNNSFTYSTAAPLLNTT